MRSINAPPFPVRYFTFIPVFAVNASNRGLIKCSFLVLYTVRLSLLAACTAAEKDVDKIDITIIEKIDTFLFTWYSTGLSQKLFI